MFSRRVYCLFILSALYHTLSHFLFLVFLLFLINFTEYWFNIFSISENVSCAILLPGHSFERSLPAAAPTVCFRKVILSTAAGRWMSSDGGSRQIKRQREILGSTFGTLIDAQLWHRGYGNLMGWQMQWIISGCYSKCSMVATLIYCGCLFSFLPACVLPWM